MLAGAITIPLGIYIIWNLIGMIIIWWAFKRG
jgi:hypothetical protein